MSVSSETFKFIYVRIPRTGSSSFVHYLETTFGNHLQQIGCQHAAALELKSIYGQQWDEFHTFGFIRNPWDWLVSMYNANISDGARGKEPLPGGHNNGEMFRSNMPFEEWIYQRNTTPVDWLSDESGNVMVDEVRLFEGFIQQSKVRVGMKPHSRYQDWYTPVLSQYVLHKCQREITLGGYTF